jgi:hypothetical protein
MAVNKIKPTRQTFILGFVGVNKTGKSATARKIAENWRESRGDKFLIAGHDPQRMFTGLIDRKLYIDPEDKNWAVKCCKLRNCLLILDEIRILCPTPQHPPKGLVTLFSQCFYNNVDIMWMTHNPSLVPEVCTFYTTLYYIYLTFTREGQFQKKIPNYSLCVAGSDLVNDYVKKYGRGKHKLDPEYNGQGFPYVKVDTENQTLTAINMDKKI